MEERMSWLTDKLQELRSQVSKEDYTNWLAMTETKMLFVHLESDLEEHKNNWASMSYEAGNMFAQGQAAYIMELDSVIRNCYADDVDIEEEDNDDES